MMQMRKCHLCASRLSLGMLVLLVGISCSDDRPQSSNANDRSAGALTGQAAPTGIVQFSGICDGSAAVKIGDDQLLVAYDEQNSLYLFDRDGGSTVREYSYQALLQLQSDDEVDLEGAVISADSIWWVGSHGLDGDAAHAPNRRLLFQIDLASVSTGHLTLTRAVVDLLPRLLEFAPLKSVLTADVMSALPKQGGFNIEGLAADADGNLMIGLRSPLWAGDALVVKLAVSADSVTPTELYRLGLKGRGIRDIVAVDDGYLMIAGNTGGGGPFTLYQWSPGSKAREVAAIPTGINAEALVVSDDYWLVLSDDGKVTRADEDAKDGDRGCDRIYKKNPRGASHHSVFFRAVKIPAQ